MTAPARPAARAAPANRFVFADPYEAHVLSRPPAVARFGSAISEIAAEFRGRHYQAAPSCSGRGVLLGGVDQLDDVIGRYGARLAHLRIIPRAGRNNRLDLDRLAPLSGLRSLSLGYALDCTKVAALAEVLPALVRLELGNMVDQPLALGGFRALRGFGGEDSPQLHGIGDAERLEMLQLSGFCSRDLINRPVPARLRRLEITNSRRLERLAGIEHCKGLTFLRLVNNSRFADLSAIGELPALTHLLIENCPRLVDIDAALHHPCLRYLDVRDCSGVKSVSPVPATSALTHLFFTGRTRLDRPIESLIEAATRLQFYQAGRAAPSVGDT